MTTSPNVFPTPEEEMLCTAEQLGRASAGISTEAELQQIIDKRDSVGKRGRERFGRLVCEVDGCAAVCNVEVRDGIPRWRNMGQGFLLLDTCKINNTYYEPTE